MGSTCHNLKIRICEHRRVSYRTNADMTKPCFSKIIELALECNHPISKEGFVIRYRTRCASDLKFAESLSIIKEKPELNGTEVAARLLIFFFNLFVSCG